jgi:hypothetical protein
MSHDENPDSVLHQVQGSRGKALATLRSSQTHAEDWSQAYRNVAIVGNLSGKAMRRTPSASHDVVHRARWSRGVATRPL